MNTTTNVVRITGYTTQGDVRGTCGHTHKTWLSAVKCCERDAHGCAKQGGYSDRYVVEVQSGGRFHVWETL